MVVMSGRRGATVIQWIETRNAARVLQCTRWAPTTKNYLTCPDQCDSVDWVSARKAKVCLFDSPSGHLPELQASPQLGQVQEATDR